MNAKRESRQRRKSSYLLSPTYSPRAHALPNLTSCSAATMRSFPGKHFSLCFAWRTRVQVQFSNRKHFPCFYRAIETRVEVWENEKCCGDTSRKRVFPKAFLVLPTNFHECFYMSIEVRIKCFLFLSENTARKSKKSHSFILIKI